MFKKTTLQYRTDCGWLERSVGGERGTNRPPLVCLRKQRLVQAAAPPLQCVNTGGQV